MDRRITKQSLLKDGYREMQQHYFEKIIGNKRLYALYCQVCGMASDYLQTDLETNKVIVKCEFCPSTTTKFIGDNIKKYQVYGKLGDERK